MQTKSYPTRYGFQLFRSRLEARWAAFFDLLGWPYIYEPFDLDGYVPDFILKFYRPLLVEVKPEVLFEDLKQHADKILNSGWDKEALIVGADLLHAEDGWNPEYKTIGLLGQEFPSDDTGPARLGFAAGILFYCDECKGPSILHSYQSFHCRANGCARGDKHMHPLEEDVAQIWALAYEKTKWPPGSISEDGEK